MTSQSANAAFQNQAEKALGSDNEWCVNFADCVVDVILPRGSAAASERHSTATCVICDTPLRGRQRRCCSAECQLAHARSFPRARDVSGEKNPNFRGWRSKRPTLYTQPYKAKNPLKVKAHRILRNAVLTGAVVRPIACESCGLICRADAHHDDYSLPLAVRWLCRKCHVAHHAGSLRAVGGRR